MSLKQRVTVALESGLDVSIEVLKFVDNVANVFPPLKVATGSALLIAQTVQSFSKNKAEWESFSKYVTETVAEVAVRSQSYNLSTMEAIPWKTNLEQLAAALTRITSAVEKYPGKSKRALAIFDSRSSKSSGGAIADLRRELDQALMAFQLMTSLAIGRTLVDVIMEFDSLKEHSVLEKLQFARLNHYDETSLCLAGTRTDLIRRIKDWCHNTGDDEKRVLLLTGVAGAGKSSIAHTIAKECMNDGSLLSSFFFKANEQSEPTHLFSDMARSLAAKSLDHRTIITSVLERDPKLATSSFTTQFKTLVQEPLKFKRPSSEDPMIIVIDALDECDPSSLTLLARILRNEVPQLPSSIKFFITSRQVGFVNRYFSSPSIQHLIINIADETNLQDCFAYVRSRLETLSDAHPGSTITSESDELVQEIVLRANGLFIWISTIFNYLEKKNIDPMVTLGELLDIGASQRSVTAERTMDELYTSILERCDWKDNKFVHDYPIVLGAMMASERPLSMMAWDSILSPFLQSTVRSTVAELSPLLTGIHELHIPIRILHQSFRDFIVERAVTRQRYMVETGKDHQRMARRCFEIMNAELSNLDDLGRILSLEEKDPLPTISEREVPEHLRYACRCAHVHASVVRTPPEELEVSIRGFLDGQIVNWIELCVRMEGYISISSFPDWVKSCIGPTDQTNKAAKVLNELCLNLSFVLRLNEAYETSSDSVLLYRVLVATNQRSYTSNLALSLLRLSLHISKLGRHLEALPPIEETVNLYRQLVARDPGFHPKLADSLGHLSWRLHSLGRLSEALPPIDESVNIYRRLDPASHRPALARSLQSLSAMLSGLGRHSEALPPSQESVSLWRELVAIQPASYKLDLARSLYTLSFTLSELGLHSEALPPIQESVSLHRELVAAHPVSYKADLAHSLHNLSFKLSQLGRHSEALPPIQESISLRRELVAMHPVSYKADLAYSLHSLSFTLLNLGQQSEALAAIQECVSIRRQLVAMHPASYSSVLAHSLHNLSSILHDLGRHTEALSAGTESLSLYRPLFADYPLVYARHLQRTLRNVALVLDKLGRPDEALAARTEADSLST